MPAMERLKANTLLLPLVAICLFSAPLLVKAEPAPAEPRSISVTGEAKMRISPDMANVHMEVVTDDIDATVARRRADEVTREALRALQHAGVDDADVDSTGLMLAPQYRWVKEEKKQHLTGYRVSRSIDVRVLDLEQLGGILEALTATGVNRVNPPKLGLQDPESVHRIVLANAAVNARERAAVLATALGAELGVVMTVQSQMAAEPRPMARERMMMAADMDSAGESYSVGEISYSASIYATFSIE
ncbi:MAG: hypothetical protein ACI87W_001024 [Halieaceae bacterium]|jgi:uncharacterized protein YggE